MRPRRNTPNTLGTLDFEDHRVSGFTTPRSALLPQSVSRRRERRSRRDAPTQEHLRTLGTPDFSPARSASHPPLRALCANPVFQDMKKRIAPSREEGRLRRDACFHRGVVHSAAISLFTLPKRHANSKDKSSQKTISGYQRILKRELRPKSGMLTQTVTMEVSDGEKVSESTARLYLQEDFRK